MGRFIATKITVPKFHCNVYLPHGLQHRLRWWLKGQCSQLHTLKKDAARNRSSLLPIVHIDLFSTFNSHVPLLCVHYCSELSSRMAPNCSNKDEQKRKKGKNVCGLIPLDHIHGPFKTKPDDRETPISSLYLSLYQLMLIAWLKPSVQRHIYN